MRIADVLRNKGAGVLSIAPDTLVSDLISAGRLLPLCTGARRPKKDTAAIHAVRMPGRSHAAKAQLFISHLRHSFGAPPYWDRDLAEVERKAVKVSR